jgi:hypothetical protein
VESGFSVYRGGKPSVTSGMGFEPLSPCGMHTPCGFNDQTLQRANAFAERVGMHSAAYKSPKTMYAAPTAGRNKSGGRTVKVQGFRG